jgi:hypothetical protein
MSPVIALLLVTTSAMLFQCKSLKQPFAITISIQFYFFNLQWYCSIYIDGDVGIIDIVYVCVHELDRLILYNKRVNCLCVCTYG